MSCTRLGGLGTSSSVPQDTYATTRHSVVASSAMVMALLDLKDGNDDGYVSGLDSESPLYLTSDDNSAVGVTRRLTDPPGHVRPEIVP